MGFGFGYANYTNEEGAKRVIEKGRIEIFDDFGLKFSIECLPYKCGKELKMIKEDQIHDFLESLDHKNYYENPENKMEEINKNNKMNKRNKRKELPKLNFSRENITNSFFESSLARSTDESLQEHVNMLEKWKKSVKEKKIKEKFRRLQKNLKSSDDVMIRLDNLMIQNSLVGRSVTDENLHEQVEKMKFLLRQSSRANIEKIKNQGILPSGSINDLNSFLDRHHPNSIIIEEDTHNISTSENLLLSIATKKRQRNPNSIKIKSNENRKFRPNLKFDKKDEKKDLKVNLVNIENLRRAIFFSHKNVGNLKFHWEGNPNMGQNLRTIIGNKLVDFDSTQILNKNVDFFQMFYECGAGGRDNIAREKFGELMKTFFMGKFNFFGEPN